MVPLATANWCRQKGSIPATLAGVFDAVDFLVVVAALVDVDTLGAACGGPVCLMAGPVYRFAVIVLFFVLSALGWSWREVMLDTGCLLDGLSNASDAAARSKLMGGPFFFTFLSLLLVFRFGAFASDDFVFEAGAEWFC